MSSQTLRNSSRQTLLAELRFLAQMASTETALFQQTVAAKFGLGITDMKALSMLQQEGAMPASQLAGSLTLTAGAVTNLIDRLEKQGLVKRASDKTDRRKVIVTLNSAKISRLVETYKSMGQAARELFDSYSTKELEFLVNYYQRSIDLTRQEIQKLG